jgi:malate synthase
MATAILKLAPGQHSLPYTERLLPINSAPPDFDAESGLPAGFLEFIAPLHHALTSRQRALLARREQALADARRGKMPAYLPPSLATMTPWGIELPDWCRDQRIQMTGPADEAELVVKMLNSGAQGVMLDLEDSTANSWEHTVCGIENILDALAGRLTYYDRKRERTVGISPSNTVIFTRPRGLHLHQAGILRGELLPASLFDVAMVTYQVNFAELRHPLCFCIPKSESADEALWWRDLFRMIAQAKGAPADAIKCMALVEAHPLAYQIEEFAWNLRDHILGLNFGRWDYIASLIEFHFENPDWVLPDRDAIPHDVPFVQNLRELMAEICHKHGMLAIGGITALHPKREDADLNARALLALEEDKKNEARCLMDGAATGHLGQNEIAAAQFPAPNQLEALPENSCARSNLRPPFRTVGRSTLAGTRVAVRSVIRYRNGVLNGKGASILDGYMEHLATDRIYRLMIAQRLRHADSAEILDENGMAVRHTPELIGKIFEEELQRLVAEFANGKDLGNAESLAEASRLSQEMIRRREFTPV